MIKIQNLLLVAGTGTKSGKTTVACRIISQLKELGITAVKITPHFHETTPGLVVIYEEQGFAIFEETDMNSSKDTSRMLKAGARKVFFAKVLDDRLSEVFQKVISLIPPGAPVICESPALRNYVEPGVFIIMSSDTTNKLKDINHLQKLPHVMFQLRELDGIGKIPVGFRDGVWFGGEW
jgi:hypothetical protein